MENLEVSVVVCTRNRAAQLQTMLLHYAKVQTSVPWELVIVDNGSTDDTPRVLAEFSTRANFPMQVVQQPNPGLSRARNTGWRSARAEIVAFSDDDCYPERDFVTETFAAFQQREVNYVGGRVLLYDADDYPITIQTNPVPFSIPPYTVVTAGQIHGANMSCRRHVLTACEGFDELMGAGASIPSGEDSDFLNRASALGYAGAYCPSIVVYHDHGRRLASDIEHLRRSYAIGRGACYAKGLLDKTRRRQTLKDWYAATRVRISYKMADIPFREMAQELSGAIRYWVARAGA